MRRLLRILLNPAACVAWFVAQLRRLRFERRASRAAKRRFRQVYPQHRVSCVHVVGREADSVVIAVEYSDLRMPLPEIFFRVYRSRAHIEECCAPENYGPWF